MGPLWKKLARTIGSTRGPFFAIAAVIMVGISVFVSMTAVSDNLTLSRDQFYREMDFADFFFHVIRAPEGVIERISAVNGVSRVTGRIQKDVVVIWPDGTRGTLRLTSVPLPMENELNRLRVLKGRLFDKYPEGGALEILVNPQFAAANRLGPGSTVSVAAEGKEKPMRVVGTAASPEFVYVVKDAGAVFEDPGTFGAAMISQNQAQQVLDMRSSINQVLVRLTPGADVSRVERDIREILEPYGNLASYPRKDQISEAILRGELDQLKVVSRFLPTFFLGLATLMQFVFLGRLVRTQRSQIGVMKALGCDNFQLMALYSGYSLVASIFGAFAGILGGYGLATLLTRLYSAYFNLPRLGGPLHNRAAWIAMFLSLAVGFLAGVSATRQILSIQPAESMRPPSPRVVRKSLLERWGFLWNRLGLSWRMSLRSLSRNRFRAGVTFAGVLLATGMLVVSLFTRDSIHALFERHFADEQRYDFLLRFAEPVPEGELLNIERLAGVIRVEPRFEIPARLHFKGREKETLLVGLKPAQELVGVHDENGKRIFLNENAVFLDWNSARSIGAEVGDEVELETLLGRGPSRWGRLKVAGFSRQAVGSASCLSLAGANALMREQRLVSGATLKADRNLAPEIERQMADMINITSVLSRQKEIEYLEKNLQYLFVSVGILVAFSAVLGFAIVYNASALSFAERRRELSSLRVMGFSVGEVSAFLLEENILILMAGIVAGLPFGRLLAEGYAKAVSTDLFSFEAIVYPLTYLLAALGGVLFVAVGYGLSVRGIRKLEFVEVLKARD